MELEEGQIVLCTVEKTIGTTVFVKIGEDEEGTITTSEIAPGRIRNLRNYVVPGKKIVCKVLSLENGVRLSLRRVKQNEKKELLDRIKKEKNYAAIISTVLGKEEGKKIRSKITQDYSISDFFEEIKSNPKVAEKYLKKDDAEKLIKIIETKKEKPKEIKNIIQLSSKDSEGITKVKEVIQTACKDSKCDVHYLAAGKYSFGIIGEDFKKIKSEMNVVLQNLEKIAKKSNCTFALQKK
jgi:translation initiation factor 2 alpha subunit (eIF-2alpha)